MAALRLAEVEGRAERRRRRDGVDALRRPEAVEHLLERDLPLVADAHEVLRVEQRDDLGRVVWERDGDARVAAPQDLGHRGGAQHGVPRQRERRVERRHDVGDLAVLERERARLGSKRVIQRLFNVSVPRACVPEKASALRDRSER